MLFVNILLINLLIAMFSFTFESVQTQTDLVWRYERYSLIREYFDRPPLFPPLIILTHLFELSKFIFRHLPKHMKKIHAKTFSKIFEGRNFSFSFSFLLLEMIGANREVDKDWAEFESYATNLYARSVVMNQSVPVSNNCPSQSGLEQQTSSDLDIKTITDEMASVRKAVVDLRTCSEEVRRIFDGEY